MARPDRKNPQASSGEKPVGMIGSRSVDRIRGSGHVRRKRRTHDRTRPKTITPKKHLRPGSHPHMTLLDDVNKAITATGGADAIAWECANVLNRSYSPGGGIWLAGVAQGVEFA